MKETNQGRIANLIKWQYNSIYSMMTTMDLNEKVNVNGGNAGFTGGSGNVKTPVSEIPWQDLIVTTPPLVIYM